MAGENVCKELTAKALKGIFSLYFFYPKNDIDKLGFTICTELKFAVGKIYVYFQCFTRYYMFRKYEVLILWLYSIPVFQFQTVLSIS